MRDEKEKGIRKMREEKEKGRRKREFTLTKTVE
jgi:hypothetical protein